MKLDNLTGKGFDGLAVLLGMPAAELHSMVDGCEALYTPHTHVKKRRYWKRRALPPALRVVHEPRDPLRDKQWTIARWLGASWTPPSYVHGFIKERSIVTNAKEHLGRPTVVVADIRSFFDTIRSDHVAAAFSRLGAPDDLVGVLTRLTTLHGRLPQGTRSSPMISNIVAGELDCQLRKAFPSYTRYADDLTFSGEEKEVPTEQDLASILAKCGFELRPGSYRRRAQPLSQWVTGLLVNHSHGPHYPRRVKQRVRQEVFYIKAVGLTAHAQRIGNDPDKVIKRVLGTLMNLHSVEPRIAIPLLKRLEPEYPLSSLRPPDDDESDES